MVTARTKTFTVRTQRLFLRAAAMEDVSAVNAMMQDPDVRRYVNPHLLSPEPDTVEQTRTRYAKRIEENIVLLTALWLPEQLHLESKATPVIAPLHSDPSHVQLLAEGALMGVVGMPPGFTLGYSFAKPYWGKGLATEAVKGFLALFWELADERNKEGGDPRFEQVPQTVKAGEHEERQYISASTNPKNTASAGVLVKVGAERVGEEKIELWGQSAEEKQRDGQLWNTHDLWRLWRP